MSVANPEAANSTVDAMQTQRAETVRDRREGRSLADKLLSARETETVTLEIAGEDVEFGIMLGETRDEVQEIRQDVIEITEAIDNAEDGDDVEEVFGMDEDELMERAEGYRDRFVDLLAEHAVDDSLDREFWLQAYGRKGSGRLASRLEDRSERADMTEEEMRRFRSGDE